MMEENKVVAPSQFEAGQISGLTLAVTRLIESSVEVNKQMVAAILCCNAENEAVKEAKGEANRWYRYYCDCGNEIARKDAEIASLKEQLEALKGESNGAEN